MDRLTFQPADGTLAYVVLYYGRTLGRVRSVGTGADMTWLWVHAARERAGAARTRALAADALVALETGAGA